MVIKDFFPHGEFRGYQEHVLDKIQEGLDRGKINFIIQAPTGSGKTALSIAIARYFKSAYICTNQKSLQKQYVEDYPQCVSEVTGRGNWICKSLQEMGEKKEDGSSYPCSEGLCKLSVDEEEDEDSENKKHKMLEKLDVIPECDRKPVKCDLSYEEPGKDSQVSRFAGFSSSRGSLCWKTSEHDRCDYYVQKMKGLNSPITIFNYNYFLIESNYVGDFGEREVLIADEGHNIEFQIANFIKFTFSNKNFNFLPGSNFPDLGNIELTMKEKLEVYAFWLENMKKTIPEEIAKEVINLEKLNYPEKELHRIVKIIRDKVDSRIEDLIDVCKARIKEKLGNEDNISFLVARSQRDQSEKPKYEAQLRVERLNKLVNLHSKITRFLLEYWKSPSNWIIDIKEKEKEKDKKIESVNFRPIFINEYAEGKFFRFGKIRVIMSATILDCSYFAGNMGLNPEDTVFIPIPPTFPPENHGVYHLSIGKLNFENLVLNNDRILWANLVVAVDIILSMFPKHKGIIHTSNSDISKHLKSYCKEGHTRILTHNQQNRFEVLSHHLESPEPTVLCTPSMTEGVDLADDSSRFQILIKVPYPDISDLYISTRKDKDKFFYKYKTAISVCQSIGRSIRSEEDWAYTFTLDSRFPKYISDNRNLINESVSFYEKRILNFPSEKSIQKLKKEIFRNLPF
jgi:Rad3-related DNA helicase